MKRNKIKADVSDTLILYVFVMTVISTILCGMVYLTFTNGSDNSKVIETLVAEHREYDNDIEILYRHEGDNQCQIYKLKQEIKRLKGGK